MRKILLSLAVCLLPTMAISGGTRVPHSERQIECLAKNIYHESRGEPDIGKEAVAWVTLNRVAARQYPNTICGVVYDHRQFSWTLGGEKPIREAEQWKASKDIAKDVYTKYHESGVDPTNGAVMFHSSRVRPYWVKSFKKTLAIGRHVFYKES